MLRKKVCLATLTEIYIMPLPSILHSKKLNNVHLHVKVNGVVVFGIKKCTQKNRLHIPTCD